MDKFDRIFQLHGILSGRRTPITAEVIANRLECSRATVFRIIAAMQNHLGAPIVFDKEARGYRYAPTPSGGSFELPGLWFSAAELQALVVVQHLLKELGGGLLEEHLSLITRRFNHLMRHKRLNLSEATTRLRFPAIAARQPGAAFKSAAAATLQRKKIRIRYHARGSNEVTERTISPQRLVHYRDCWYLDGWDEGKRDFRSFSVDRILRLEALSEAAKNIPDAELDAHFASSYGIFGGVPDKLAILRFSPERARWVAAECWHPQQQSKYLADGTYELHVPYKDSRELVMDILRHGHHVRVIEPQVLRDAVIAEHKRALAQY